MWKAIYANYKKRYSKSQFQNKGDFERYVAWHFKGAQNMKLKQGGFKEGGFAKWGCACTFEIIKWACSA
jgi:hypothetical protein